jgi:hypothetical protein
MLDCTERASLLALLMLVLRMAVCVRAIWQRGSHSVECGSEVSASTQQQL